MYPYKREPKANKVRNGKIDLSLSKPTKMHKIPKMDVG